MKATLLIVLYLARDTVYRWLSRLSSPLSRVLVVFFLSFCGLIFLASYVISLKVVREQIQQSGGNLVVSAGFVGKENSHAKRAQPLFPPHTQDYDAYEFREAVFGVKSSDAKHMTLVEMPMTMAKLFRDDAPLRVLTDTPSESELPMEVFVDNHRLIALTLPESEAGFLRFLYPRGAVLMPEGGMPALWANGYFQRIVLLVKDLDEGNISKWEDVLNTINRLDGKRATVLSSAGLLRNLRSMEGSQRQFRIGISLGISLIICFLLTSISSLEYRQNEYVYALIGSFGVSRFMLFSTFVVENTVLLALGFLGALGTLQGVLPFITNVLYRSPRTMLSLLELKADIQIFCFAFIVCIAVSSLPILAAVAKPIGKVLK